MPGILTEKNKRLPRLCSTSVLFDSNTVFGFEFEFELSNGNAKCSAHAQSGWISVPKQAKQRRGHDARTLLEQIMRRRVD